MTLRCFLPGATGGLGNVPGSDSLPDRLLACSEVLRSSSRALRELGVQRRTRALAGLALSWRDPEDPYRREALRTLPEECGLSREMVEQGIDQAFSVVTEQALRHWWSEEAKGAPYKARAEPPELSAHIWAGNVFVAGLPPVIASLLAGSPALIKAPGAMPSFASLLAQSLQEHAPELGPCLAAAAWSRADIASTTTFLDNADLLFAFGDDSTIEELKKVFFRPLFGFSTRYSIAVISAGSLGSDDEMDAVIDQMASDQFSWEGLGCLTPRWIFVEGPAALARLMAERAADRLPALARKLPAQSLSDAAAGRRSAWLGETGFAGWSRAGDGWCCAALESASLEPVPPSRSMCFLPIDDLDGLPLLLSPLGQRLQGLAFLGPERVRARLVEELEPLGLSRSTGLGELQHPPVHWSHDGVRILAAFC